MSETRYGDEDPRRVPPVDVVPETAPPVPAWPRTTAEPTSGDPYRGQPATGSTGGSGTATVAADQARQVASTAADNARDVMGEARTQARQVAGEARHQAMGAVRSAQGELRTQASQQTERAAKGLQGLAGQIQALVEGRPDQAGLAGDYARQAGDRVSQFAGRLQDGGFDGLVQDVRSFARRRPGLFLIGAAAAGFAAGRMIRASRDSGDDAVGGTGGEPYAPLSDRTQLAAGYAAGTDYPATPQYAPTPPEYAPAGAYPPPATGGAPGAWDTGGR
jgi:hypothetical protein